MILWMWLYSLEKVAIIHGMVVREDDGLVLCAAKDETSVEFMGRKFCGNFLRKS
jgi:hypothetical protein